VINPITDAGPFFLGQRSNKSLVQTRGDEVPEKPLTPKGEDLKAEKEVEQGLPPTAGGSGPTEQGGAPVLNPVVEPAMANLAHAPALLPLSTVHTTYSVANDMTGGRVEPMPLAIQRGAAGSTENGVSQLGPPGGVEQRILHDKAAYYTTPIKDWRHEAARVMDGYYTEKYKEENQPVVKVEYSRGPTIFRTPSLAEAEANEHAHDMAERIREGVQNLKKEEEEKKAERLQKERVLIKEAFDTFAEKSKMKGLA